MGRPRVAIVDGKKQCSKCKEWLDLASFHKSSITSTGLNSRCKSCNGCTFEPTGPKPKPLVDGKMQCRTCGAWKPLEELEKNKACRYGRTSRCKACGIKKTQEWASRSIENYLKNLACHHKQNLKFRTKHRSRAHLWQDTCVTYEFLLDLWKKQDGRCAVTGVEMTYVLGEGGTQCNLSIDRIDSSLGYIPENVQLVCKQVNLMKHTMDHEDLMFWCRAILECNSTVY